MPFLGSVRHVFFICINPTGTAPSSPANLTASPTIINTMLWMKKNAYEDTTTKATAKRLKHLLRNCDFNSPETVKTYIANKQCSNAFKECLIETYDIYMRSVEKTWNKPFYQRYDKTIKIPTEERTNILISNAAPRMSLFLSMIKDTGARPIELTWLKVSDCDLEKGTINITGAKHTMAGIGKLKTNTLEMLKKYISHKHLNANDRIFPTDSENISEQYRRLRNRIAEKLQDSAYKTIRLYDFRHYKASVEYHKTNSMMHVKAILRHKDIRTTVRYVHLFEALQGEDYFCSVAKDIKEATSLIENGFEYVTEIDGIKLFRKRK